MEMQRCKVAVSSGPDDDHSNKTVAIAAISPTVMHGLRSFYAPHCEVLLDF